MRRLIIYILVCVVLCACSESNSEVDSTQQKVLFNIEVSAPDTRTALVNEDGKYKAIWKEGDFYIVAQIAEKESSFCTGTVEADTPSIKVVAEFEQTEGSSYRYLFASPNLAVSADCATLGFPLPSRQSPQGMDTFDGAADVILSDVIEFANQPSNQTVTFNTKRVSAVGKVTVKNVALAEGDAVRSIIFACEHPLAGDVTNVVVEDIVAGNDPLTNSIIESASNTITVMLHEPQTGEFTCFFSCLPATLAAGESYIVTLNTEQNHSFVKQAKIPSDLSFTSGRMTTFTVNMAGIVADAPAVDSANCQILYTSTDGNVVTPYATDVFGATIVSNTYENGQGVITFDGEVTKIGGSAFRGCTNLKTLNIPNSVTSIERWAFLDCDSLEEFFGSNIINNGRAVVVNGTMIAFAQGGLTSYALPSEVTAVDVSVFESCDKLTEISLGENINTIGGSAFDSCIGITSITIPQSVTTIGNNAFHSCTKLGTVYVESATPPTGEDYMFNNNAADRKIYVPASSVEAYKSAQHWSDYADAIVAEVDKPANNQIFYTSTDGAIVTPYDMSAFGANIVSNTYENGLGIIIFDGEVTKIGTDAFCGCQNLTSIVIGDKVTFIGVDAFSGCNNLASVSIPSNVTSIGRYAFCGCSSLVSVTIPNSITTINLGVFKECSNLKSVTIPNSITEIGVSAFSGCSSLTSVTIPDSVLSIGDSAFSECSSLISINIPNSINTLGANPFKGCSKLAEFNGKFASSDKRCLIVEGELNSFASADIIEYTIPYNTTSIGFWAFEDCCNLQLVTIPNSVTLIKNGAFMGCKGLISITIPDSITSIWDYAFRSCNNLRSVYCKPITPPSLGSYVFASSASDCKIYVPAAYVETYKWVWSEYADSIVAEGATSGVVDLSVAGTANCYLVNGAGSYKFKAVKGNSLENFSNGYSADVLWESFGTSTTPNVGDLITNVAYKDGYISFSTPATFKSGNASIALRDSSGKILWSWHIWCSAEGWNDQVYPNNAGTMMDRNLGATSATPGDIGAFGLLYQWGRKDPFMGTCAMSESTLVASTGSWNVASSDNMDFAMENPMTFATGWYGGGVAGEGWHTSESEKGLYDPCPVGYRVPDGGANGFWATAFGTSDATSAGTEWDSINYGHHWTLADGTTAAWYPAVGYRGDDSGALSYVGSYGFYWSASPNPSYSSYAYNLFFDNGYVFPADTLNRGYGQSVRCVRE